MKYGTKNYGKIRLWDPERQKMSIITLGYTIVKASTNSPYVGLNAKNAGPFQARNPHFMAEVLPDVYELDIVQFKCKDGVSRGAVVYDTDNACYAVETPKGSVIPLFNVEIQRVIGSTYQDPGLMGITERPAEEVRQPEGQQMPAQNAVRESSSPIPPVSLYICAYNKGGRAGCGYALSCKQKTFGELSLYEETKDPEYYLLRAVITGLSKLKKPSQIRIITYSKAFQDKFSKLPTYAANGWADENGESIKNATSWSVLFELLKKDKHIAIVSLGETKTVCDVIRSAAEAAA